MVQWSGLRQWGIEMKRRGHFLEMFEETTKRTCSWSEEDGCSEGWG